MFVADVGNGFSLTIPADAATRVLRVRVGGWNSAVRLSATLSEGSASDYTDDVPPRVVSSPGLHAYTFQGAFQAIAHRNWTKTGWWGNVTINDASLSLQLKKKPKAVRTLNRHRIRCFYRRSRTSNNIPMLPKHSISNGR